ncbi:unnamed protein product [Onchocerca ochengi]|nr:unnamed protein product [Onchocerca ochengi]
MTWEGDCAKLSEGDIWWRIRYLWLLFIPNAMFAMYVAIFYSIRRKQRSAAEINQNQKNKKKHGTRHETNAVKTYDYERSMLIQAAWNCGVMEIGGIIFHFLPPFLVQIFGETVNIPSNIFINCYVILSCTTLPTVYFIYNKAARNILKEYFDHLLHMRTASSKNKTVAINVRTHTK